VNSVFGLEDMSPRQLDAGSSLSAAWGGDAIQMQNAGLGEYFALLIKATIGLTHQAAGGMMILARRSSLEVSRDAPGGNDAT